MRSVRRYKVLKQKYSSIFMQITYDNNGDLTQDVCHGSIAWSALKYVPPPWHTSIRHRRSSTPLFSPSKADHTRSSGPKLRHKQWVNTELRLTRPFPVIFLRCSILRNTRIDISQRDISTRKMQYTLVSQSPYLYWAKHIHTQAQAACPAHPRSL